MRGLPDGSSPAHVLLSQGFAADALRFARACQDTEKKRSRHGHREDVFARRGAEYREGASLSDTKPYRKSAAAKYAEAIERLREEKERPTSEIAAEFGLHPEVFRQYLKEHEPELYARQGMMRASNGRSVSRRSMEKYAEAIRLYETTTEDLKSIAGRLGLTYNSLGGFLRRNFPELIRRRRRSTEPCGGDETERSAVPASLAI